MTGPRGGALSRVTVADDVVTSGWAIPSFQLGIHVSAGAVASVSRNRVTGNVCDGPGCGPDPINEGQGIGILVQSAIPGTTIAGNHVAGNDVGVYQFGSPDCCRISQNTLDSNRWFGIVIQDGDGDTSHNTITGGLVGVGVVADAVDTTGVLRGDRITAAAIAPVREIQCCGYTATVRSRG